MLTTHWERPRRNRQSRLTTSGIYMWMLDQNKHIASKHTHETTWSQTCIIKEYAHKCLQGSDKQEKVGDLAWVQWDCGSLKRDLLRAALLPSGMLLEMWGKDATIAHFQRRSQLPVLHHWNSAYCYWFSAPTMNYVCFKIREHRNTVNLE